MQGVFLQDKPQGEETATLFCSVFQAALAVPEVGTYCWIGWIVTVACSEVLWFAFRCDGALEPGKHWHVSTFLALATKEVDALTGNCLFLALRQ